MLCSFCVIPVDGFENENDTDHAQRGMEKTMKDSNNRNIPRARNTAYTPSHFHHLAVVA
jgi:hypothetical protein